MSNSTYLNQCLGKWAVVPGSSPSESHLSHRTNPKCLAFSMHAGQLLCVSPALDYCILLPCPG